MISLASDYSGTGCYLTETSDQTEKQRDLLEIDHKTESLRTMQNKKGFEYKNASDCDTEPFHLLSLIIAWDDFVNPNSVI